MRTFSSKAWTLIPFAGAFIGLIGATVESSAQILDDRTEVTSDVVFDSSTPQSTFTQLTTTGNQTIAIKTGATVEVTRDLRLGVNGNGVSPSVIIDGGSLVLSNTTPLPGDNVPAHKYNILGHYADTKEALLELRSGYLDVAGYLNVGWDGHATYRQSGGTANIAKLYSGGIGVVGTGTIELSGGELNVDSVSVHNTKNPITWKLTGGTMNMTGTFCAEDKRNDFTVNGATVNFATNTDTQWFRNLQVLGGELKHSAGTFNIASTDNTVSGSNGLLVGWGGSSGSYTISGSGFLSAAEETAVIGGGALNILSGASANVKGIALVEQGVAAKLNVQGGILRVGANGIAVYNANGNVASSTANTVVAVNGGTLEALVDWSSAANMTFSNNGTINTSDKNVVLSGSISGYLSKTGSGKLTLAGSYSADRIYVEAGSLDISGQFSVTDRFYGRNATINFLDGANANIKTLNIADSSYANSVVNQSGGTVTITGTNTSLSNQASLKIGHYPGNGTYNLSGGTLNALECRTLISLDGNGTMNVTGGTANLKGITLLQRGGRKIVFNLDGGRVNLGSLGLAISTDSTTLASDPNVTIALGDGILGALADWNSIANMTLDGTLGTVFNTQNPTSNAAQTVTLAGILSGNGGLTKSGVGTLVLAGLNTYSGNTVVEDGTLQLTGAIAGNVQLDGGILTGSGTIGSLSSKEQSGALLISIEDDAVNSLNVLGNAELYPGMFDLVFDAEPTEFIKILEAGSFSNLPANLNSLLSDSILASTDLSVMLSGNALYVGNFNAVPEPSAWLLLVFGGSLLFSIKKHFAHSERKRA